MAVLANNSEGSSVPPEVAQNLEVDDEYNKYTPSADYNSASGRLIFRNKKFTKKRHESKSRRTDVVDDASNACASDEGKHFSDLGLWHFLCWKFSIMLNFELYFLPYRLSPSFYLQTC